MTKLDPYHIEDFTPLRNSILWDLQRNYFKHKGIEAWQGEVPFYISSNAFIADRYAQLVIAAIKDSIAIQPDLQTETFYIAELGAGVGQFSFYFLKSLLRHAQNEPVNFCYIMTDVVEKNKAFWQTNAYFQELVSQGKLDFAILDVDIASNTQANKNIFLQERNMALSDLNLKAPLIIVANYVFDCIKQDVLAFSNNQLSEVQFQIKSRYKNYDQEKAEHLKELRFEYSKKSATNNTLYSDPVLNNVLTNYQAELSDDSLFTVPLGAIEFLNQVASITNNNYLLILGDKGFAAPRRWSGMSEENLFSYDGCYSFMVNFDLLGRYLKAKGGDYLLTHTANVFKINLYASKHSFLQLTSLANQFTQELDRFGADEFCYLNEAVQPLSYGFTLKAIRAHLRLSNWDVRVYQDIHDRLIELVSNLDVALYADIIKDIEQVEDHIYHYPGRGNVYNQLGIFYQAIDQPEIAIRLYNQALEVFGQSTESHHNLGMIYDKLGNSNLAIYHYEHSVALNKSGKKEDSYAKNRIARLNGNPSFGSWKMLGRAVVAFALTGLVLYYLLFGF